MTARCGGFVQRGLPGCGTARASQDDDCDRHHSWFIADYVEHGNRSNCDEKNCRSRGGRNGHLNHLDSGGYSSDLHAVARTVVKEWISKKIEKET